MSLEIVYDGAKGVLDQRDAVDIVAVHGIGGDAIESWMWKATLPQASGPSIRSLFQSHTSKPDDAGDVMWLRDLLPSDFPEARIMTFRYKTMLQSFATTWITTVSKLLLDELMRLRRESHERGRPIIFVAHSLGGIVVSRAILFAHNDSQYNAIEHFTVGIIFFGTPFRGSNIIRYSQVLGKLVHKSGRANKSLIKELQRDCDSLERLSQDARQHLSKYKIITFYETKPTHRQPVLIVDKHSAVMDLPNEVQIPAHADHSSICKFPSKEHNTYIKIVENIRRILHDSVNSRHGIQNELYNRHYMVPQGTEAKYVPRNEIEKELERHCLPSGGQACYVLFGIAGTGKSSICLKFARDHRKRFWGIFWIPAHTEKDIVRSMLKVAKELDLEEDIPSLMRHLSSIKENWLLIFDDVEDPSINLSKYFPVGGCGTILITSRNLNSKHHATVGCAYVGVFDPSEEELLMRNLLGADEPGLRDTAEQDRKSLANAVHHLPLAFSQAFAYMRLAKCTIPEYLTLLPTAKEERLLDGADFTSVFETSFQAIEKDSQDAMDILYFLSFLSKDIRINILLRKAWTNKDLRWPNIQLPPLWTEAEDDRRYDRLEEAICLLGRFCMIYVREENEVTLAHQLVQSSLRARLSDDEFSRFSMVTAATLAAAAGPDFESEEYSFREELLSHLTVFLDTQSEGARSVPGNVEWAEALSSFAAAFKDGGQLENALELESKAMALNEQLLGPEHKDTLRSMGCMSRLLRELGKVLEAAALDTKVLKIRSRKLGDRHPETLESMESLASSFKAADLYNKAVDLYQIVLNSRKRTLGGDDPLTLAVMGPLAECLVALSRHKEALGLQESIIEKGARQLGTAHPNTLLSVNNLAATYGATGRTKDAVELYERVVPASTQALGKDHPTSLTTMQNLAAGYSALGRHAEAVQLERRVLESRRKQFGDMHPDTLGTIASLAAALEAASQVEESLPLRREQLQLAKGIFGPVHIATFSATNDLGSSSEANGRVEEALNLREKSLRIAESLFGYDHPETLRALSKLENCCVRLARDDRAKELRASLSQRAGNSQAEHVTSTVASNPPLTDADSGAHDSDSDSTCSEESTLSRYSSTSSQTSLGVAGATLVERTVSILEDDPELIFAYDDLRCLMNRRNFVRRHMRALRAYFGCLYPTTEEERQAASFLSRFRQRRSISESIYDRCSSQFEDETSHTLARFDRLRFPDPLGHSLAYDSDDSDGLDTREEDQSDDESENGNDMTVTTHTEPLAPPSDRLTRLLNSGNLHYKACLRELIDPRCSPRMIRSVVAQRNAEAVRAVLERHFETVAINELDWLRELRSLGYDYLEIAELLLDEDSNTPWIFIDQPPPMEPSICPTFHAFCCAHRMRYRNSMRPKLLITDAENSEHLQRVIAQQCGLAGVVPKSRDMKTWVGLVNFTGEGRSIASVTYAIGDGLLESFSRACEALRHFCGVATHLQAKGLCCNSFTVLRFATINDSTLIELCPLKLGLAQDLFAVLQLLINNWDRQSQSWTSLLRLNEIADDLLDNVLDTKFTSNLEISAPWQCLDRLSLIIQVLNLGMYLYSQAHTGPVHPFFLISPLSQIRLLGIQQPNTASTKTYLATAPARLTCMNGVIGDVVNVIGTPGLLEKLPTDHAYDLLASPADLAETWDAGRHILDKQMPSNVYAIELGDGFLRASESNHGGQGIEHSFPKLHWDRDQTLSMKTSFKRHAKSLIGTTTVNDYCPINEHESWLNSNLAMDNLGVSDSYWERSAAQLAIQGGQYAVAQFNVTWKKRQGKTLKHIHLQPDISLPFLQSDWGLQISYCTGVARRVSLCELLADLTPYLVGGLLQKPQGWKDLYTEHRMIEKLRSSGFETWYDDLDESLQDDVLRIIRYVLLILQNTGIDRTGEHLVAAWPRKGSPLACFKIPCNELSYWARMLQDSPDCATFAYITPLCLETNQWRCQKLGYPPWQNRSGVLTTSVFLHKAGAVTTKHWELQHDQKYLLGPRGNKLVGKVTKNGTGQPPHIDISKSIIPKHLHIRLKENLREKQSQLSPSEEVVVSTGHYS